MIKPAFAIALGLLLATATSTLRAELQSVQGDETNSTKVVEVGSFAEQDFDTFTLILQIPLMNLRVIIDEAPFFGLNDMDDQIDFVAPIGSDPNDPVHIFLNGKVDYLFVIGVPRVRVFGNNGVPIAPPGVTKDLDAAFVFGADTAMFDNKVELKINR